MVIINGKKLYDEPTSCGTCPFLMTGNTDSPISTPSRTGICIQWDETHHTWANCPRRCKKLFREAFKTFNDTGLELVITIKE